MAAIDDQEMQTAGSVSEETAVELSDLLWTALNDESDLEAVLSGLELTDELLTALSSLEKSTQTAREDLWTANEEEDEEQLSTCLSATASQYSLPASETFVEMPVVLDGVTIKDSLECLAELADFQPKETDFSKDWELKYAEDLSEYEMPPSETEVTMTEADLRLLV